jgi:hypothetical protein
MKTHQTRVIVDESQVPEGYIRLKNLTEKYSDTERKRVSSAHSEGRVRAVKIMRTTNDRTGATYVHKEDAEKFLMERKKVEIQIEPKSSESEEINLLRRIASAQDQAILILLRMEKIWKSE